MCIFSKIIMRSMRSIKSLSKGHAVVFFIVTLFVLLNKCQKYIMRAITELSFYSSSSAVDEGAVPTLWCHWLIAVPTYQKWVGSRRNTACTLSPLAGCWGTLRLDPVRLNEMSFLSAFIHFCKRNEPFYTSNPNYQQRSFVTMKLRCIKQRKQKSWWERLQAADLDKVTSPTGGDTATDKTETFFLFMFDFKSQVPRY